MRDTKELSKFILRNSTFGAFGPIRLQKLDFEKLNKWIMSQRPEPECTGRCFGCHNSLCINSIFPYEELEKIAEIIEENSNETHNSHRNL